MDWHTMREIVLPILGAVGGLFGLIGGGVSTYVLVKRFRREEESKKVEARADELTRQAHEAAASRPGSTIRMVPIELSDEIDRKAAWRLCKEGNARMHGNTVIIDVDLLPKHIAQDMARRAAMRAHDPYH